MPPGTMVTAGQTGQVGQVWVSYWILLSATCILCAQAQGKIFFVHSVANIVGWSEERATKSAIGIVAIQ